MDKEEKLTGNVVFLYPDLKTAILATYDGGKMISGDYARLKTASITETEDIVPELIFTLEEEDQGTHVRSDLSRSDPALYFFWYKNKTKMSHRPQSHAGWIAKGLNVLEFRARRVEGIAVRSLHLLAYQPDPSPAGLVRDKDSPCGGVSYPPGGGGTLCY